VSLNTFVEADPDEMRAFAEWLDSVSRHVEGSSDDVSKASTRAFDGWTGLGSSGFHNVMGELRPQVDGLGAGYSGTAVALALHANDITTAKARMQQARDIAHGSTLPCSINEIFEPGPPPPEPEPSGARTSNEQRAENAKGWQAWLDWKEKAKAYADCAAVVTEGRKIETDSQGILIDYLTNVAEKSHINGADFVTGLAAGYLARQSTWRANAKSLSEGAGRSALRAADSGATAAQRAIYEADAAFQRWGAKLNADRAASNLIGTWLEKLPERARKVVVAEWKRFIPNNTPYLSHTPAVIKKVPVVGTALTGGSVIMDVAQGKDVGVSVASNGGGLLAGAAVGGAIGGPPGAVAGFIVATGTGFAIEEFGPEMTEWFENNLAGPLGTKDWMGDPWKK
jgi:uncharacterized protein YukE